VVEALWISILFTIPPVSQSVSQSASQSVSQSVSQVSFIHYSGYQERSLLHCPT